MTLDWQNQRVSEAEIDTVFASDAGNIGLMLGRPSNGLVVVAVHSAGARRAALQLLPSTGMVSGRESTPAANYWFVVDDPPSLPNRPFVDPTVQGRQFVLLELRSTGAVTEVPPSICPPEPDRGYEVEERSVFAPNAGTEPMRVELKELESAISAVAAAALLSRYWPRGARPFAGRALAEVLLGAGWDPERCRSFLAAVCAAAQDPKYSDYASIIEYGRIPDQLLPDQGSRTLAEHLGPEGDLIDSRVREWLALSSTVPAFPLPLPPTDPDRLPPELEWPAPPETPAFHGLAGEFVKVIEPETESDPVALLGQFLVHFGIVIGRSACFRVEADRHFANENLVLIGSTSKGRKGASYGHVRRTYKAVDSVWAQKRVLTGLASGGGLISAVRDPVEKQVTLQARGKPRRKKRVQTDPGEPDKRLLVYEPEFANVLKQIKRADNTLSAVIRQAWEDGNLGILTKNSPLRATGAHVGVLGHITDVELIRYLTATEAANGFGNRFIWLVSRRSKTLPGGGQPNSQALDSIHVRLNEAIQFARGIGEVRRDKEADEYWRGIYEELAKERAGLAGHLLGRSEAHTMRLALIYALLDRCTSIGIDHLKAAYALWRFAERSVQHVFGDSLGDPLADKLLNILRYEAGPMGLTTTDLSNRLGNNVLQQRRALSFLLRLRRVRIDQQNTAGRTVTRWIAVPQEEHRPDDACRGDSDSAKWD